jgi:RNA polymerase-interacting CarD/CdnL/TRCF family regulator
MIFEGPITAPTGLRKLMTQESETFLPGDWIVHRHYGVSRVVGIEKRRIGESENTYCKMQNDDSTFWIPVDKLNEEWLRPVAPGSAIQLALEILISPAKGMDTNPNVRRNLLRNVDLHAAPATSAELLRDLWAFKRERKHLSQHEERALRLLTDCFIAEWSVCMNLDSEEVEQRFRSLVHPDNT